MSIDTTKHQQVRETLAGVERLDPKVEQLVTAVIGRVADKWTMILIDLLAEKGEQRFSELQRQVPGISEKMLAQTLRGMEQEGLVSRTVHAEVPPRVEYRLTDLGLSLGSAFCGVWMWAEQNLEKIEQARKTFARRHRKTVAKAGRAPNEVAAGVPKDA